MPKPLTPLLRHLLTTLLVAAACVAGHVLAQTGDPTQQAVVEIVRLQHRDPDTLRQALEPVLDPRGAISQIDNNLIISTSRANLQQLQPLIETLDVPLRQLRLSVDFAYRPGTPGVLNENNDMRAATTVGPPYNRLQNIVLTEGEYAYFNLFESNARTSTNIDSLNLQLQQDLERNAQSVSVTAEVLGDRALLELRATRDAPGTDGSVRSELVSTTWHIGLNGWYVVSDPAQTPFPPGSAQIPAVRAQALAVQIELLP